MELKWMVICIGLFIVGLCIGFVAAVFIKSARSYKSSGILHIKQTEDKDYYTIEITDNLESIQERHAIILTIDVSRDKHVL